jgi:hypothetical protein
LSIFPDDAYNSIINYLGPHGPDGLLAFVIFAGVLSGILAGLDPWLTAGFGIAIYLIYCARRGAAERHEERTAEQEVVKTQLELDRYRVGQRSKLEREKLKRLSPPAKPGKAKR